MRRLEIASVLENLAQAMRDHGSWMGETHLQKATYFLQELLQVPLGFSFILYKHGPFSFDLREFLAFMEAERFIKWQAAQPPYGPSLRSGPMSLTLSHQFGSAVSKFKVQIDFVAAHLGRKNVSELERIATALFVTQEEQVQTSDRMNRIKELKPHIELPKIREAIEEFDKMSAESSTQRSSSASQNG